MRIRYVNPVGSDAIDAYFARQLAGAGGADAEIEVVHAQAGADSDSPFLPPATASHGAILEALAKAQADGCDAAVIGCSGDPTLLEARRAFEIPVTAPLDSALHLAAQLHQRVAILVADGFEAAILFKDLARLYGLDHLVAEVHTIPMDYPETHGGADHEAETMAVIERHREVLSGRALELARGSVERGAGVVYAGCTFWTGEMLDPFRAALGVPVLDPGRGAVAMAAAAVRAKAGIPAGAAA
ncbi:aspartate/glutamate racemase family protein [Conexibacter arvalis]|uniref:Allantoin racemase n=1 Tax=Conexibacter arvalis TaxID=912552 RepID=A0A840I8W8_9ACTN|nr:aspartate/glutamate racemase family protein [Conexibacter arvalis]MBB4661337.1 allantoin racemase [Conexibacter arvalis]